MSGTPAYKVIQIASTLWNSRRWNRSQRCPIYRKSQTLTANQKLRRTTNSSAIAHQTPFKRHSVHLGLLRITVISHSVSFRRDTRNNQTIPTLHRNWLRCL